MENENVCKSCGAISYGTDRCPICGSKFSANANRQEKGIVVDHYDTPNTNRAKKLLVKGEEIRDAFTNDYLAVRKIRRSFIGTSITGIIVFFSIIYGVLFVIPGAYSTFNSIFLNIVIALISPAYASWEYRKFGTLVTRQSIVETNQRFIIFSSVRGSKSTLFIWYNQIASAIVGYRDYSELGEIYYVYLVPAKCNLGRSSFRTFGELAKWIRRSISIRGAGNLIAIGPLGQDGLKRISETLSREGSGSISLTRIEIEPEMKKLMERQTTV